MSVVVGICVDSGAILGCDSAISCEGLIARDLDPKIWRSGGYLIGAVGSPKVMQEVRVNFTPPRPRDGMDVRDWIIKHVTPDLSTHGTGCDWLIAYKNRIFQIDEEWAVYEPAEGYCAIGEPETAALACFRATRYMQSPVKRVTRVLESVARYSPVVAGPFSILETA